MSMYGEDGSNGLLNLVNKFRFTDPYEGPFTTEMVKGAILKRAYEAGFEFSGEALPSIVPEVSVTYEGIANALNYVYIKGVYGKSVKLRPEIIVDIYAEELVDRSVGQLLSLFEAILAAGIQNTMDKKNDFDTTPIPFDTWS